MSTRQDVPVTAKRPTGGRPLPKRLFSFESLRKDKSVPEPDVSSNPRDFGNSTSTLRLVEKPILELGEDPFADTSGWTEKPLVSSPEAKEARDPFSSSAPQKTKPQPLDLESPKPNSIQSLVDDATPKAPVSPGRRRWDTIRTHVLPSGSIRAETPPLPEQSRDIQSPIPFNGLPARPSTPKGYRFGQKRAMRQVVDEVRAGHQTRKLQEDIRRACWTVRFGELPVAPRPEREPSQSTVGSSLHLPFMSLSPTSLYQLARARRVSQPQSEHLGFAGHLPCSLLR